MRHLAIATALVALALAIYFPVVGFGIVNYDDDVYLAAPHLGDGLSVESIRWAFTSFYKEHWHPLTWLSWLAEVELFGVRPAVMHLGNVLLHAANGALLYAALFLLTNSTLPSALAAALFVVHPVHVESVAWVSERHNVLSVFFGLWALIAYARYARAPGLASYLAVAAAFALSLLSKPLLVTLPFALLLLDYWPTRRSATVPWSRLVLEKVPLLAFSIGSSLVTLQAAEAATREFPFADRVAYFVLAYVLYLEKLFAPVHLAALYPRAPHPDFVAAAFAAGALALVSWNAWVFRRRFPYLWVGWAWYVGTLVPAVGVPMGELTIADRYAYWPNIGLFVALAFWLDAIAFEGRARPLRIAVASGCAACVATLAVLAHTQTWVWRDSETLWRHALDVTEQNYVAHANLGRTLLEAGHFGEAQLHFGAAMAINSDAFRPAVPGQLPPAPGARSE
jgi:hypothetical protein